MTDVTNIREGRWALSRPIQADDGWTTYASQQKDVIGASGMEFFWPPFVNGAPAVNAVLVRMGGMSGAIVQPADGNTRIFPRDIAAVADVTLGEMTAAQRNALRNTLETWLTGYTFADWDGTVKVVPTFADVVNTYTNATILRQVARDVFKHFSHSADRPRPALAESHNTEYTEAFDTDPAGRWSNPGFDAAGVWNSGAGQATVGGDNNTGWVYSDNDPGSIEHEAQTLSETYGTRRAIGPGVRMREDQADGYGSSLDQFQNLQIWKFVNNSRSELAIQGGLSYTNTHWVYMRLAGEGTAGSNVALSFWYVTTGSATKAGSDGGWQGVDGSPDYTFSDTAADRLDDSAHISCGFCARGNLTTAEADYWRTRAISDRGGGGGGTVYTRVCSESVEATDTSLRSAQRNRTATDPVSANDAMERFLKLHRLMAQDGVDVNDALVRSQVHSREVQETLEVVERTARWLLLNRHVVDAVQASDVAARYVLLVRLAADAVDARDSLASQVTLFGQAISFILAELRKSEAILSGLRRSGARADIAQANIRMGVDE